jgi:hypothetical protein
MNTEFGKPFTVDGFSCFLRDAIKSAGLPLGCQPHGLRKAAGRRLAEAGCSARQIMAVLGHKSLSEAERYTRDADQKQLAEAAIIKLEKNKRDTELPNHDSTVRQKSEKAKQNQSEQKGLALPRGVPLLFESNYLAGKWDSFRSMIFQDFSEQCPTRFPACTRVLRLATKGKPADNRTTGAASLPAQKFVRRVSSGGAGLA